MWLQQTLPLMISFRKAHHKHFPLQMQGKIPPPLSNGLALVFMAVQFWDMITSVRSAVEAGRKAQSFPQQVCLLLPDPCSQDHACILLTAYTHKYWGKEKQRASEGKRPLFLLHHALPYISLYPLEQEQKKSYFFTLDIWDRNHIPLQATATWLIVTRKDFIHSTSSWGQATEQVKCLGTGRQQGQVLRHCRMRLDLLIEILVLSTHSPTTIYGIETQETWTRQFCNPTDGALWDCSWSNLLTFILYHSWWQKWKSTSANI